jgi:hypothetical protein
MLFTGSRDRDYQRSRRAMIPLTDPHTWATLARATGGAGLTSMVLAFAPVIAMSSSREPDADATREEAAAFFHNTAESSWADAAGTVALLGLVALTWFTVGLCLLLRHAVGEPPWRSLAVCIRLLRNPA